MPDNKGFDLWTDGYVSYRPELYDPNGDCRYEISSEEKLRSHKKAEKRHSDTYFTT